MNEIKHDMLTSVNFLPTKNCTPGSIITPKFIVIGATEGTIQAAWDEEDFLKKSPHLQITVDGTVHQRCLFTERAWYCGASHWQGYYGLNAVAIAVELEARSKDADDFSKKQYAVLDWLIPLIVETYRIRDIATTYEVSCSETNYMDPTSEFPVYRYRRFTELGNANSMGRYVVTGNISVYAGPDPQFDIVDELKRGEGVSVIRQSFDWRMVSYQKENQEYVMGWVHDSFIKRV